MPYTGQHIPYIPAGYQPNQQAPPAPKFSNIVKDCTNTNVCFMHGFDMEEWHTSATCNIWKPGHQERFTGANFMEYEHANHQFCCKAMHKTMYLPRF
jgi:hypothetical protein